MARESETLKTKTATIVYREQASYVDLKLVRSPEEIPDNPNERFVRMYIKNEPGQPTYVICRNSNGVEKIIDTF